MFWVRAPVGEIWILKGLIFFRSEFMVEKLRDLGADVDQVGLVGFPNRHVSGASRLGKLTTECCFAQCVLRQVGCHCIFSGPGISRGGW